MRKIIAAFMTFILVFSGLVYLKPIDQVQAAEKESDVTVWDGTTDTSWYDGHETATEYTLTTAEQLAGLAELTNKDRGAVDFQNKTIKLGADIVLNDLTTVNSWGTESQPEGVNKWTPIGNPGYQTTKKSFRGSFDGQGHTIFGMYLDNSGDLVEEKEVENPDTEDSGGEELETLGGQQGLFGVITYSENNESIFIKNISLVNSYVCNKTEQKVGMLVGEVYVAETVQKAEFLAENIYVEGTINSTHEKARIAGVCGVMDIRATESMKTTFKNVVSNVNISSQNAKYAGGILGSNENFGESTSSISPEEIFENCVNSGDLQETAVEVTEGGETQTKGTCTMGGIYGYPKNSSQVTINNCVNTGTLKIQKMGAAIGNVTMNTSNGGSLSVTRFINIGEMDGSLSDYSAAAAGAIYGGSASDIEPEITQCYTVAVANENGAKVLEKSQLTGSTALAQMEFDTTDWAVVEGVAPVPKAIEEMCNYINIWDGTADTSWYDEDPSEAEYTITTAEQLAGLAVITNRTDNTTRQNFEGKTIKLGADIVLNYLSNVNSWGTAAPANIWTPIGNGNGNLETPYDFRGVFEGQGRKISGMYIESATESAQESAQESDKEYKQGLFGLIVCGNSDATAPSIKNLSLVSSHIMNSSAQRVGMLTGQLYVTADVTEEKEISMENLYVQGVIDSTYDKVRIAGVCGTLETCAAKKLTLSFKNVVADVDVSSESTSEAWAGGLLGRNEETTTGITVEKFENCVNLGDITEPVEKDGQHVLGGLYGYTHEKSQVTIINCVNAGNLKMQKMGAAIGTVKTKESSDGSLSVTRFINVGTMDVSLSEYSAGAAGAIYGGTAANVKPEITQCYTVDVPNSDGATEYTREELVGSNTLTTLEGLGFENEVDENGNENWTMIAGIAPLPRIDAQMCGLVFKKTSLTLYSSLQMNFKVKRNTANGWTPSKVVFTLNDGKDGRKTVTDYVQDGDYYIFSCSELASYQMGDRLTATLYGAYDSVEFAGSVETSISDYCYKALETYNNETEYGTLRTLIADLLTYGAESQNWVNYKTDSLVNAKLSETGMPAISTDSTLTSVTSKTSDLVQNPRAEWKSAGLNLKDKVIVRLKFYAEDTTDLRVKFSDDNGNYVYITEFTPVSNQTNQYYVYLDQLNAYQMSDEIYATVYNSENVQVSETLTYSIESYACDVIDKGKNPYQTTDEKRASQLVDIVKAMMRYGNSAKTYLGN